MSKTRVLVDPTEDIDEYCARWDKLITEHLEKGETLRGRGPFEDEPLGIEPLDAADPAGPYYEVWEVVAG